ncbi:MAG: ABC transporter ATP-binding protein [Candidatus Cloacimonetes bacterium]|nr:ABC transporter ATP-binding protein [Candidatus Cloacimonadota bacterium]
MFLLEAKNIYKTFSEGEELIDVLKGTDFQLSQSETVAITGESGCGKSTLLHILGLLDKPDKGVIEYYGKEIKKQSDLADFRNSSIGFVFQFHFLLEDFNAEDNVAMPMFIKTRDYGKSLSAARKMMELTGIIHRKKHYPSTLSGGEQQRVAIARAMINNPAVIFADEPTGNLDPQHSKGIIDLMLNLNKSTGQSFVIVTHNPDIAGVMQTHYKLSEGKLKKQN